MHAIEGLRPIGRAERVFALPSYVLMLWASLIVLQGFVLGQALLPPQGVLTLVQGVVVVLLASAVMAAFMVLNGQPGLKYGIPYCIHARAAFGIRGARLPEILRLAPAIVWYGFGTWIAALAVNGIVDTLTGFSPSGITYAYFVVLLVLQTWLAYRGIRMMKWFTVAASIALIVIMGYMLARLLRSGEVAVAAAWGSTGDWGWPFWAGVNATIGILVAVMASASDLTRYLEARQRTAWLGHLLGVAPPLSFMMFFGFVAAVTTGVWDPIEALMALSPGPVVMVLLLVFILIAQFSTNLTVNIMPPAFIFQELFGTSWRRGVIITGVLACLTFPWLLLESGVRFVAFINYYTAFFGPLVGCMLADYWAGGTGLDVAGLYVEDDSSPYWYHSGVNWAGVIGTVGAGVVVVFAALPLSWLAGMPMGFLIYLVVHGFVYRRSSRGARRGAGTLTLGSEVED